MLVRHGAEFIVFGKPRSAKAQGLIRLSELGLRIPSTVICADAGCYSEMIERIGAWRVSELYARIVISDSDYPHTQDCVGELDTVRRFLWEKTLTVQPVVDVIVQEFMPGHWSGGALITERVTMLESVFGCAKALFRDGLYFERVVANKEGEILWKSVGNQKRGELRKRASWVLIDVPDNGPEVAGLLKELRKIHTQEEPILVEWVFRGDVSILVELTVLPAGSYQGINAFKANEPLVAWDVTSVSRGSVNNIRLELPQFSHIDLLRPGTSIVISKGAALAHLVKFAIERNIPCKLLH